ncbi:MAG: hypothetical protein AAB532_01230 [Patescibacteria group bacterium]
MASIREVSPSFIEGTETVVGYPDRPVPIKPVSVHHIADFQHYARSSAIIEGLRRRASSAPKPHPLGR